MEGKIVLWYVVMGIEGKICLWDMVFSHRDGGGYWFVGCGMETGRGRSVCGMWYVAMETGKGRLVCGM